MKSDKIILLLSLMILLTAISWITSCTHKTDATLPVICYNDVNAIIGGKCYLPSQTPNARGCHDNSGEGRDLSTYQGIYDLVIAGNPEASPLYKAIIKVHGENKMPPDQPISQESRTTIRIWIEQGALDNSGDTNVCPKAVAKRIYRGNNTPSNL